MTRWDDESMEVPECEHSMRRGGPQGEGEKASTDEEAKRQALAAKKAEVRKRLEEAGKKGKKKKGFLTPERKKKLRKLLMIKAAENLKNQQKQMDSERQNVLSSRIPACPNLDTLEDKGQLEKIYNDLFQKMIKLEEEKFDINFQVGQKDSEINEMTINVNDLRGKFVKPTLKKVSKYDNKFRKAIAGEGGEAAAAGAKPKEDFRAKLKAVEKKNVMEVLESKQKSKAEKPEWSKKGEEKSGAPRRPSAASSSGTAPSSKSKPEQSEQPPQEEEEDEEEVEEGDEEEEEE